MTNHSLRVQIAQETLQILEQGWYIAPSGKQVNIAESLATARLNSVLYKPQDFLKVFAERDEIAREKPERQPSNFKVVNATTLFAARQILESNTSARVLCLNFASAKHPGGGFLNGSQAQEESLARASGLYPCISQMEEMYRVNKQVDTCLYTDHMIYSPQVSVFRDDNDVLLEEPFLASFITAPAVNARAIQSNEPQNIARIGPAMINRIEKVLSLAVLHHHDTLILGAWGCGVFKNNPVDVAQWFYDQLTGNGAFQNAFKLVCFAILDKSPEQNTIRPFTNLFT